MTKPNRRILDVVLEAYVSGLRQAHPTMENEAVEALVRAFVSGYFSACSTTHSGIVKHGMSPQGLSIMLAAETLAASEKLGELNPLWSVDGPGTIDIVH